MRVRVRHRGGDLLKEVEPGTHVQAVFVRAPIDRLAADVLEDEIRLYPIYCRSEQPGRRSDDGRQR